MRLRSLYIALVAFLISACVTRDPPPPAMAVTPAGSSMGEGVTDSPKFSEGDNISEDEWGNPMGSQNGALDQQAAVAAYPVIYFAYDQAALSSQTQNVLQQIAMRIKSESGYNIQIEGHCDERGTTEYNLALGDRRANSVREYLETLGVAPQRLSTISYGEERPTAEGHTESEFALNRRVEFKIPSMSH